MGGACGASLTHPGAAAQACRGYGPADGERYRPVPLQRTEAFSRQVPVASAVSPYTARK
jgi:hypothetical protein